MTRRTLFRAAASFPVTLLPGAPKPYFPPPDSKGGWRTLASADRIRKTTGIDTAKLDEAFEYCKLTSQHGGLLVARHGWLVYEKYFGRGHREATPELASCGKAYTSIACGIMLREYAAKFPKGLDQPVFTPEFMPASIFPLDDPRKARITLGQLLAMSAGIRGTNPGWVNGQKVTVDPPARDGPIATIDKTALAQTLWTDPGAGYSYATSSPHLASIVLRRVSGIELQDYLDTRIGKAIGWGRWGYALNRPNLVIDHTPGGGSIAMRSTDVLRFAYLLLHKGRWGAKQVVPAEYVEHCGRKSPYNPHYRHSLEFEVNQDGDAAASPPDAFWKGGAGGYCIYAVPSLDLVIYKMGGNEGQYDPALTKLPVLYQYDGSRANWKPDPSAGSGTLKLLDMVVGSIAKAA